MLSEKSISILNRIVETKDTSKWEIPTNSLEKAFNTLPFTKEECLYLVSNGALSTGTQHKYGMYFQIIKPSLRGCKKF